MHTDILQEREDKLKRSKSAELTDCNTIAELNRNIDCKKKRIEEIKKLKEQKFMADKVTNIALPAIQKGVMNFPVPLDWSKYKVTQLNS